MEYVCRVGTPSGDVVERAFTAPDERALRAELEQQGLYLLSVRRGLSLSAFHLRKRRVDPATLLVFSQELAALLKAGLPLFQSLDVMLDRQRDPVLRQSLTTVRQKVKSGVALSDAFRQEGELYPPIFSASLVAGERSGNLDQVLRRFSSHLRLNQTLRKKAVSAAVYPIVLLTMMTGLVAILLVWVIPQFKSFYEGLGAELPLATRMLLAVATTVRSNLLWIVLGIGLLVTSDRVLAPPGGVRRRSRPHPAGTAVLRGPHEDVRHQPAHAHAGDAAGRGAAPDERPRGGGGLHRQPGDGPGGGRRDRPHPGGREPHRGPRVDRHARGPAAGDGQGRGADRGPRGHAERHRGVLRRGARHARWPPCSRSSSRSCWSSWRSSWPAMLLAFYLPMFQAISAVQGGTR